jgi:hypothetical protein
MDTNPHQKANDLAFTDRIDTELFFGTMSLGKRNAQLQSRYTGAKSLKPDIQLIVRMIEGICGSLRVRKLGLDSKSIWSFVEEIPFQPPGVTTGYDGLRDIATLSVLFTQKPQLRTTPEDEGIAIQYDLAGSVFVDYESSNPHAGPLEDISRSSVSDIIEGIETANLIHGDEEGFQPQSLLKRVLGFRFTDSIVKMSRALAFLRGKEYVGRREIVDALPFCLGHRLGRARAEGDQEPTGIDQSRVPSEQQFVRQVVVHGYLLRDAMTGRVGGDGDPEGTPEGENYSRVPAFDVWDAYFAYCEQKLASAVSYAQFEQEVLHALKEQYLGDNTNDLSTVHWHLATSVVEREREGITNMHPSHYTEVITDGARTEGDAVYADVLDHYRKLIARPEKHGKATPIALTHDFAGVDYFNVRGRIASDRFLFSDDKAHLLDLVDSRITQLCGQSLPGEANASTISNPAGAADTTASVQPYTSARPWTGYGLDPRHFPWRSYGDAAGAWGIVITGNREIALNAPAQISHAKNEEWPQIAALADQTKSIVIQCVRDQNMGDDERKKQSEQEVRFRTYQLPSLIRLFDAVTKSGVIFSHNGSEPLVLGTDEPGVSPVIPTTNFADQILESKIKAGDPCTVENILIACEWFMKNRLNGGGSVNTVATSILDQSGILGCFPLDHCVGAGSGNIPQVFRELMDEGEAMFGKLRLWIRFHEIAGATDDSVSFQLCMGVTSDLADFGEAIKTTTLDDGTIMETEVNTMSYLDLKDAANYSSAAFREGDDRRAWDSGNLTKEDGIFYDKLFSQAMDARVGTIETD